MRLLGYVFVASFAFMCLHSCNKKAEEPNLTAIYQYPENVHISDKKGNPNKNVFPHYYPSSIRYILNESSMLRASTLNWDSDEESDVINDWCSYYLYIAEEPILYNYYLGADRFRFYWERAFEAPVLITLKMEGMNTILETKVLRQKPFHNLYDSNGVTHIDSIRKTDIKTDIISSKSRDVSFAKWINLLDLLDEYDFWKIAPEKSFLGVDGSTWVIEAHFKDRYWFVNRWSPKEDEAISKIGEYLIKLSGIEEEIY